MEENMSDDDNREKSADNSSRPTENAKRLKTDNNGSLEKSEESSSSSNNTEQESASTSTDSGFPRSRNSKNRNYRNKSTEEAVESQSDNEDSAMQAEESEDNMMPLSSPASSDSTVIHDTDTDSDDEVHPILKKTKPKHKWFIVPEVMTRQIGKSSKYQTAELFQRRCYGSLHCVQRLELMYKLEEHNGCVNSLHFHPDGSLLASGSDDLKVVIWDWKLGKCLLKYDTKHRGNIFQSKFLNLSGDLHIATSARDGQVRIAQISREGGVRDNRKLGSHRGPCHKLSVLPEQPHVVLSAGEDGLVLSHDVRKNKPERIVQVKDDDREVALYSIHGHPLKSHEFCVGGRDYIVRVYDQRKSNEPVSTYYPFKSNHASEYAGLHVTCAVYNHDGSQILASYNDADIYLFDVNGPPDSFIHQYQGHRNGATIKGVNFFGPKSEFIVSGSDCGNVYFWEKDSEAIVQWMLADDNGVCLVINDSAYKVNCLEPHPQLPFICTSGLDWDVKVWVPSCENEPTMADLAQTIKNNNKSRLNWSTSTDINESQMLWMLWRHLRSTNRMRRVAANDTENFVLQLQTNYSSSASSSTSDTASNDEEDILDGPTGCSAS
ncbi:hypothetical protein NQ315_002159 [Exocentrus adspersus]|uniref:DDB1- and CUL4-associated factor 8 n=1 Tax=Exocentrus adspersus TaxID=1586481 RepID=A0AAV8VYZ8_9CUCU|nr:hypothetical protein NQ315_002159 [Exocentrus adspersus]